MLLVLVSAIIFLFNESFGQPVLPSNGRIIINGREAGDAEFPYQVSLQRKAYWGEGSSHICGASIIDEYHVLTAGHCIFLYEQFPSMLVVVAGTRDISIPTDPNRVNLTVEQIYLHEEYIDEFYFNDIALLRVSPGFPVDSHYINSIPMQEQQLEEPADCIVTGWGTTRTRKPSVQKNKAGRNWRLTKLKSNLAEGRCPPASDNSSTDATRHVCPCAGARVRNHQRTILLQTPPLGERAARGAWRVHRCALCAVPRPAPLPRRSHAWSTARRDINRAATPYRQVGHPRPTLDRLRSSAVRGIPPAGIRTHLLVMLRVFALALLLAAAARADDLPRVQSWQRCACAASEPPSLATVVTAVPGQEDFAPYMTRVEEVLETQCDIVDPLRCFEGETLAEDETVDFVVVGAGTAGAVVAGRLSEHSEYTVALLEAGGPEPTATQVPGTYFSYLKSDIDWNYPLEPQTNAFLGAPDGRGYWPRGKVMGGTGVLHGMMYMRGNKWDYDNWAALGNTGWSFDEVLPYFKKSEDNRQIGTYAEADYHGTGGPVTIEQFHDHPPLADKILAGAGELGYRSLVDLAGHNQTGFTLAQSTTRDGARLSLSKAFLHSAVYRSNLKISQHSLATKILIDPSTKRATGVQYERDGVLHNVHARKEVIVSAGAVASPQLLLLSGIGPKADLEALGITVLADLPVGENLLNHVSFTLKFRIMSETAHETLSNSTVHEFITNRTGPLTSTGLSQLTGFIRSSIPGGEAPNDVPDTQIFFAGFLANASRTGADDEQPITGPVPYFEITPTLLRPSSAGTLKLRSADPHDLPLIHANYFAVQRDVDVLVDAIKFSLQLAQTTPLQQLQVVHDTTPTAGCESIEYGSDEYWACSVKHLTNPENHQAGTASMGTVVDSRLKVKGIDGLRVIDASVMPRVPGGNVNGPIIMVAEKGVDMVIQDNAPAASS